jgi:hypothetical protein
MYKPNVQNGFLVSASVLLENCPVKHVQDNNVRRAEAGKPVSTSKFTVRVGSGTEIRLLASNDYIFV